MLGKKKGFTLLELLVAAAIISVLMMFATQTFRQTGSDIRTQNAKARAKVIAMAARIFKEDHPTASFSTGVMGNEVPNPKRVLETDNGSDSDCSTSNVTWQMLVNCGYLENRQYMDGDFDYSFSSDGQVCITPKAGSRVKAEAGAQYCTNGISDSSSGGL